MSTVASEPIAARQRVRVLGPKTLRISLTFPLGSIGIASRGSYLIDLDYGDVPERELVANPQLSPGEQSRPYYFHTALRQKTRAVQRSPSRHSDPRLETVRWLEVRLVLLRGVKLKISTPGAEASGLLRAFLKRFIQTQVLRVQDIKQVPPLGEAVDRELFLPAYNFAEVMELGGESPDRVLATRRHAHLANVAVKYIANGVQLQWLWSKQVLQIRLKDPMSEDSGFSFSIKANQPKTSQIDFDQPLRYTNIVHVKVSGNVELKETYLTANAFDPVHLTRAVPQLMARTERSNLRFYRIQRVKNVADLPGPEDEFECDGHDATIPIKTLDADILSKVAIDMVIGSIPVIGDLIEIGEFFYALGTGKDKYGDDVTKSQLAIMGVAAFVPIVSSGMLRGGYRAAVRAADGPDI